MDIRKLKKIDTTYPLNNKWIRVRMDRFQLPDKVAEFYTLEGVSYVMVCGITPQNKIVFARQYRNSIGKENTELPAGRTEEKEKPIDTARREFEEETGYTLTELHPLGRIDTHTGRTNLEGFLFAGKTTDIRKKQALDETEAIQIEEIPILKVLEMIRTNQLQDMPSLSTILLTKERFPEWFKP